MSFSSKSSYEIFISTIFELTINDGGVTVNYRKTTILKPVDMWYFPKYPGVTKIIPQDDFKEVLLEFLQVNEKLLQEKDVYLGTWINPKSKMVYIDINTRERNVKYALELARKYSRLGNRNIVSIFNPAQNKTIYI